VTQQIDLLVSELVGKGEGADAYRQNQLLVGKRIEQEVIRQRRRESRDARKSWMDRFAQGIYALELRYCCTVAYRRRAACRSVCI